MESSEKFVSKREFDKTINDCTKVRKKETAFFITRAKYKKLLGQVKTARKKKANQLHPRLAKLVKKYDVITTDGVERLVVPCSTNKLIYVAKDELYSVISQVHLETDHGKLPTMTKSLKTKYKNVASEAIAAYLKLCQKCQKEGSKSDRVIQKRESPRGQRDRRKKLENKEEDESKENKEEKSSINDKKTATDDVKPKNRGKKIAPAECNEQVEIPAKKHKVFKRSRPSAGSASTKPLTADSRTVQRIDFIEMMSGPDYDYNFIMVLRESMTKFVHLRPLRTRTPEELAEVLRPIFICFGTPSVLECSNVEFIETALEILLLHCPSLPDDIKVEGTEDCKFFADMETMVLSWVCENSKERWYSSLRFVQYMANLYFNEEIGKTPFEAMFGRKGKLDVSNLSLPPELLQRLCVAQDPEDEDEEEERDVEINEMLEVVMNDED